MKILLADDHALIRSGLRIELEELDGATVFVEAWDADTLRHMLEANSDLDLALIDLKMPGMNGGETIGALRRNFPAVPIIVLSGADAAEDMKAVLRAGAAGFIPKTAMSKVLMQAIRLVLAGGQYIPPQLMNTLNISEQETTVSANTVSPNAAPATTTGAGRLEALSPRQREVFALLAMGLSNKMIARQLHITEGTVKSHVATIFDVLNVHNRVSAVAEAQKLSATPEDRRQAAS